VERRPGICSRCGGSEWVAIDASHRRCTDCGLGSTVSRLTAGRATGIPSTPGGRRAPELAPQERWRRASTTSTFEPYGLDRRWTGPRWAGGHGSSNGRVTSLELAHGDRGTTEPQLRVETRIPQIGTLQHEIVNAAHHLVMGFAHHAGGVRDEVRNAMFPRGASDPFVPWDSSTFSVDGVAHRFHLLMADEHWIAVAELETVVLALTARAWSTDDVSLETIRDLADYEN
jgi:hypothetical protein